MRRSALLLIAAALFAVAPRASAEETVDEQRAPSSAASVEVSGRHSGHSEHVPTWDDINWMYGMFGEREGVEPSLLFRPKGMPAPFGIWILDALVLYGFLYRIAKKPVREALKNRKTSILRGMEEAARMKRDAEVRLADYEEKLATIEHEVERVRREMREASETERAHILQEARARRASMEEDAKRLVEQELAAAADTVKAEMIASAMRSAQATIRERLRTEDQQRLADEYLAGLGRSGSALRGRA